MILKWTSGRFVPARFKATENLMTMTLSSKWWFVCAVPLAACGGERNDSLEPSKSTLAGTGPVGAVCGTASENGSLSLACPAGQTIASVQFASYGNPSGSCGSYAQGTCHAASSSAIVAKACVGKTSCAVVANDATFGDPCDGTAKRLYVQAGCKAGTTAGSGGAGGAGGSGATSGDTTAGSGGSSTGAGFFDHDDHRHDDHRRDDHGGRSTTGAGPTTTTGGAGGSGGTPAGTGGAGGSGPTGPANARPSWNTGKGFYVVGNKIYDANGVEFRMRGVNHTHWWGGTNEAAIPYIANSHANASRAVFGPDGGAVTAPQREAVVKQYIAAGIVPVVDYHNATCARIPLSSTLPSPCGSGPTRPGSRASSATSS